MESFSMEEAKKIAFRYYNKLIDRLNSQGYSNEIVKLSENDGLQEESNYYLRFYKEDGDYKDYLIKK